MKRMIAWFATNHVAANLLMGFAGDCRPGRTDPDSGEDVSRR